MNEAKRAVKEAEMTVTRAQRWRGAVDHKEAPDTTQCKREATGKSEFEAKRTRVMASRRWACMACGTKVRLKEGVGGGGVTTSSM